MESDPAIDGLIRELDGLPPEDRVEFLAKRTAEDCPVAPAVLLRTLLSSPDKAHRDAAAEVANRLGINPFADEPLPDQVVAEEPILVLGFDEDGTSAAVPVPSPPASRDEVVLRFECTRCGGPLVGAECPACRSTPAPGFRLMRRLLLVGAAMVLVGVWSWLPPSGTGRRQEAERCAAQRARLEAAVARYKAADPAGELQGRFLSGSDFQGRLMAGGFLEETLICPTSGESSSYFFRPQPLPHVQCRTKGHGSPR